VYESLRDSLLRLVKAPTEPPEAPAGTHASVEVLRASPRFLTYRILVLSLLVGFVGAIGLVVLLVLALAREWVGFTVFAALLVPFAVLSFVGFFLVRVDYDMRYYVVTDRSLRVREGAWTVREMTITYANVQNLQVEQGPLERIFGIWNLRVDTAGGGGGAEKGEQGSGRGHRVVLAGIENAHAVRDQLLECLRARPGGAGLGDPDDEEHAPRRAPFPALIGVLREVREAAAALHRSAAG